MGTQWTKVRMYPRKSEVPRKNESSHVTVMLLYCQRSAFAVPHGRFRGRRGYKLTSLRAEAHPGCRSSIVVKGLDEVGQNLWLKRGGMWLLPNSNLEKIQVLSPSAGNEDERNHREISLVPGWTPNCPEPEVKTSR